MIGSTRLATCRTRTLLGSLAATAALALGIQAMAPPPADAMRNLAQCEAYVADAVRYFNQGNYKAYAWNMNQAEICYNE